LALRAGRGRRAKGCVSAARRKGADRAGIDLPARGRAHGHASVASINEGVARVENILAASTFLVNNAGLGANHPALDVLRKIGTS